MAALDQCDILPSTCQFSNGVCQSGTCTPLAQLSFGQRSSYYQVLYSDTALQACQKWKSKRHPSVSGSATAVVSSSNSALAVCGISGKGTAYGSTTTREPIVRESCCEANIFGPHASVVPDVWYSMASLLGGSTRPPTAFAPRDGASFTNQDITDWQGVKHRSQVGTVRDANQLRTPPPFNTPLQAWMSDLNREELVALKNLEPSQCGGILAGSSTDPCAPQVDHIIPRKDVFGCDCGPNSFRNAMLISRSLNQEMSNNCSDPKRIAILQHPFFQVDPLAGLSTPALMIASIRPDLLQVQTLRSM